MIQSRKPLLDEQKQKMLLRINLSIKETTTNTILYTYYTPRPRPRPLFQDQDRFFKDHQIINPRPLEQPEILIEKGPNWKIFCDVILVT